MVSHYGDAVFSDYSKAFLNWYQVQPEVSTEFTGMTTKAKAF